MSTNHKGLSMECKSGKPVRKGASKCDSIKYDRHDATPPTPRKIYLFQFPCFKSLLLLTFLINIQALPKVESVNLSQLTRVCLDMNSVYRSTTVAKAIYVNFFNNNPIYIQLWRPFKINSTSEYVLSWQQRIAVNESKTWQIVKIVEPFHIMNNDRFGILNIDLPGPIFGDFSKEGGVSVSESNIKNGITIKQKLQFDELLYPYTFSFHVCNSSDCKYAKMKVHKTKPPYLPSTKSGDTLLSRGMIILLLTWNAFVAILLFIVIVVMLYICVDTEENNGTRVQPAVKQKSSDKQTTPKTIEMVSSIPSPSLLRPKVTILPRFIPKKVTPISHIPEPPPLPSHFAKSYLPSVTPVISQNKNTTGSPHSNTTTNNTSVVGVSPIPEEEEIEVNRRNPIHPAAYTLPYEDLEISAQMAQLREESSSTYEATSFSGSNNDNSVKF